MNKEFMKLLCLLFALDMILTIYGPNIYIQGVLGPIVVLTVSDSRQMMVYDVDLFFIIALKSAIVFLNIGNILRSCLFMGKLQLFMVYVLPLFCIYIASSLLVKIGGMGCGDPIIFLGLCLGMTWGKILCIFFGAFILAAMYCLLAFFLEENLGNRIALGPFICMAYVLVCFLLE